MNWAKVAYYYQQSLRSYGLSRSELETLQVKKLKAVLNYADRNVPGHHEMFAKAGFDPSSVDRVEDLRKLPPRSKDELMRLHDVAQKSGRAKGATVRTTSGTTTGQPSVFATSADSRALACSLRIRRRIKHGMRPWSRVATLWAPDRFWRQQVVDGQLRPMTGGRRFPMRIMPNFQRVWVDPWNPIKDGKILAGFRPQFINGKPSQVRRIAKYCGTEFELAPKAITVTGEVATETCLKEIRRGFGAKVLQHYGSSGFGGLASDCIHETGLHLLEDYKVCEVLKDGEQVSEGEVGEVVVTCLFQDVVPVIRFRTGDYARMGPSERCVCGSSTRRLISVEGREGDYIVGKGGEKFLGLGVANRMESEMGFRDFQLIQSGPSTFTLLLRKEDLEQREELRRLTEHLQELVGSAVHVDTELRKEDDYWRKARPVMTLV